MALGVGNQNSGIVHLGKSGAGSLPACGNERAYISLGRADFDRSNLARCKRCEAIAQKEPKRQAAPVSAIAPKAPLVAPWGSKPASQMSREELRSWLAKNPRKEWRQILEAVLSMKLMRNEDNMATLDSVARRGLGLDCGVEFEGQQSLLRRFSGGDALRGDGWNYVVSNNAGEYVEKAFPYSEEGMRDAYAFAGRNGMAVWEANNGQPRYLIKSGKDSARSLHSIAHDALMGDATLPKDFPVDADDPLPGNSIGDGLAELVERARGAVKGQTE